MGAGLSEVGAERIECLEITAPIACREDKITGKKHLWAQRRKSLEKGQVLGAERPKALEKTALLDAERNTQFRITVTVTVTVF